MTHPQNCFADVEYYYFFSPVLSASGNSSSDSHAPPQECQYHFKEMHQFRTPLRRARLNDPNPNNKMWRYVKNPPAAFGMELPVESFLDSLKTSRACHLWFGSSAQCITLTQNKLKQSETSWAFSSPLDAFGMADRWPASTRPGFCLNSSHIDFLFGLMWWNKGQRNKRGIKGIGWRQGKLQAPIKCCKVL